MIKLNRTTVPGGMTGMNLAEELAKLIPSIKPVPQNAKQTVLASLQKKLESSQKDPAYNKYTKIKADIQVFCFYILFT